MRVVTLKTTVWSHVGLHCLTRTPCCTRSRLMTATAACLVLSRSAHPVETMAGGHCHFPCPLPSSGRVSENGIVLYSGFSSTKGGTAENNYRVLKSRYWDLSLALSRPPHALKTPVSLQESAFGMHLVVLLVPPASSPRLAVPFVPAFASACGGASWAPSCTSLL